MGNTEELYSRAAEEAVEEGQRLHFWTVHSYYEVKDVGRGKAIAVAPRIVPEGVHTDLPARRTIQHSPKGETIRYRQNVAHLYQPLAEKETADLFFKFARLGDGGAVAPERWLEFVRRYGVLGVLPGRTAITVRNTAVDALPDFTREASLASRTLRLFEAATVKDGPETETILELLPDEHRDQADDLTADTAGLVALWAVGDTIQHKVLEGCYPHLIPRDNPQLTGRSPLVREWAFNSLLGAMWLQFMWLTTAESVRHCAGPACNRVIDFERPDGGRKRRKDAKFCSNRCRFNHHYHKGRA